MEMEEKHVIMQRWAAADFVAELEDGDGDLLNCVEEFGFLPLEYEEMYRRIALPWMMEV